MSTSFFDTLAAPNIRQLSVYQPGKPLEELERELGIKNAIKLASNENPMGPSPRAVEAARAAVEQVHWYPDGGAFKLRRELSERLGVSPDELLFGAGSNEIIHMLVRALCRPDHDEVVFHRCAFLSYRMAATACNVQVRETEVTDELACDPDAIIEAMGERTKLVILANPNNPTGAYIPTADFERILEALPPQALLVADEAYHEFADRARSLGEADWPRSQPYRSADMPRIFTLRTFSKIYGLSGLRVGYGIGDRRVVDMINRVRRPFNLNSVAQAAALAALGDAEHIARSLDATRSCNAAIRACADDLGLRSYPSLGNFILVDVRGASPGPGSDSDVSADRWAFESLQRQGVIVRPMTGWGVPGHIRISAATPEQTERVVTTLRQVLGPS